MAKSTWKALEETLRHMDQDELIGLLKEVYNLNAANKALLGSRLDSGSALDELAEKCRKEIDKTFMPPKGSPSLKYAVPRKALREYAKIVKPLDTLNMELYYVEMGISCTETYGYINDPFYNSVESMWKQALKRASSLPPEIIPLDRIEKIFHRCKECVWWFFYKMRDIYNDFIANMPEK